MRSGLVLARAEKNDDAWMSGQGGFQYSSRSKRIQDVVGDGGTLWVCMSSANASGGRKYSLLMEIRSCRTIGTPNSEFGEYSVEGDPTTSRIFAQNNAKLPLLSLRFEPANPIDAPDVIGNSLQQLRELNQSDQALLAEFADAYANWEAFLSYSHRDHVAADDLTSDLERSGIKTFHDSKSLKGGDFWWSEILKAIEKAKCLIVVVGKDTSSSEWVPRELEHAVKQGKRIVPVLLDGGSLEAIKLPDGSPLSERQAIKQSSSDWMQKVIEAVRHEGPHYHG